MRYNFDFKKLMDYGIVFITQPNSNTGNMKTKVDFDPETGEYFETPTKIFTLYNVQYAKLPIDEVLKLMRNMRPDQSEFWTKNQYNITDDQYAQILWGIKQKGYTPEFFEMELPQKQIRRISDIMSGQDAYKQTTGTDTSMYSSTRFPSHNN